MQVDLPGTAFGTRHQPGRTRQLTKQPRPTLPPARGCCHKTLVVEFLVLFLLHLAGFLHGIPKLRVYQPFGLAAFRINRRVDICVFSCFRMSIGKSHVTNAGEFQAVMANGINPFILSRRAGRDHAGCSPPQAATGGGVGRWWLRLLVTKNQTIGRMNHLASFKRSLATVMNHARWSRY